MTEPDDRELEQYLKGDSPLSRRYREASGEVAPPGLDEAVLAHARAELKRKPALGRWTAGLALAASLVLGVNLSWNVYKSEPLPPEAARLKELKDAAQEHGFVPSPPEAAEDRATRAERPAVAAQPAPATEPPAAKASPDRDKFASNPAPSAAPADAPRREAEADALREQRERKAEEVQAQRRDEAESKQARQAPRAQEGAAAGAMAESAPAPALAPSMAAPASSSAAMSESQKIETLIAYIGRLQGAVFIRNGVEYGPADAASHLRLKRDKAGDRVRTAEDFIRLCASYSSTSGEAYLVRFPDGRTRTAEDVLREELARIEGR